MPNGKIFLATDEHRGRVWRSPHATVGQGEALAVENVGQASHLGIMKWNEIKYGESLKDLPMQWQIVNIYFLRLEKKVAFAFENL